MARLAICAVVLALAAPSARAGPGRGAPPDQTGLFQTSRGSAQAPTGTVEKALVEESDGPSEPAGYAFEDYKEGTLVEVNMQNGTWVLGTIQRFRPKDFWEVKLPGQDHRRVPSKLVRRRRFKRESDWLVAKKGQQAGEGIAYRRSKNLDDVVGDTAYAPFDSLVVGRFENGWVKTSRGYLPMRVDGAEVLAQRVRKGTVKLSKELREWYLETEEARRKAALAKAALEQPPPPQSYEKNEVVFFQTSDGEWLAARVAATNPLATYTVFVQPAGGSEYMVSHVHPEQLRKIGPPKRTPVANESLLCQKSGGCMELLVKTESGEEHKVSAGLQKHIGSIVKWVCARILHEVQSCETRVALWHDGRTLGPSWRTFEAGLADGAVVDIKLAPLSVTHLGEEHE